MTHLVRATGILLLLAAVTACGATPAPAGNVGDVSLRVTGGITGWDRTVVVRPDGTITYTVARGPSPSTTTTVRLDEAALARLHQLVSDPGFANLARMYSPPAGGADLQRYDVTATVGGRTLTTATWDGAITPEILRDVIVILNTAMAKAVT